jgi:ribosome maturation factor RimP
MPAFFVAWGRFRGGDDVTREDAQARIAGEVERAVTAQLPDVDVVDVHIASGALLRVLIDHPRGVDHELCATVTSILRGYTDRYSLEVSSPGIPRPLVKPAHYARFLGHEVVVKTTEPIEGKRSFTGTLREADDRAIVVAANGAETPVAIPLALVRKSHLVQEP